MNSIKTLFLAANPADTSPLKLDEEIRAITEKIRASEHRDSVTLISVWAVRPDDLLQLLNEHRPQIVHFSGHGSSQGEIVLVDDNGMPKPVSATAISALFRTLKDNVRVVLLNACYSRVQAEAITEVIDCAIGMNAEAEDRAAIIFAASFYRAIGFGRSVQEAYEQGKAALLLEGILEEGVLELISKHGVDPSEVFLLGAQHCQHFSWHDERLANDNEAWMREGLEWLRTGFYRQYGSDRVKRFKVTDYSKWEQVAASLDTTPLYKEGRLLVESREYAKATACWAELWRREPKNPEYESYLRLCLSKIEREIRIENAISALIGMAASAMCLGMYHDVIEYMNKVLALSPNHPTALQITREAQEQLSERNKKNSL